MNKSFKILLATDYSKSVMNAEHYAVQMAKNTHSVLTFLHVYQMPFSSPDKPLEYSKSSDEEREYELKRLEQHRDKLFQSMNIKAGELSSECILREGATGNQICKGASENDIDIIIAGTHGETGFIKAAFGSHTWSVIKKSSIPVLAVPEDGYYTGIKKIVFGTEYRSGEIPVLNYLSQFAKIFDAEIIVLHVTNYSLSKSLEKEMFEKFRNEIKGKILYDKLKIQLIKNEDMVAGLNTYSKDKKIDILVMSPEKKDIFERILIPIPSMTRKMSLNSSVPLLTIPDFYNPEYAAFWRLYAKGDLVNEDF